MLKLTNGATFGTGRATSSTVTALIVDPTLGSPTLSVETDPTEFLDIKTFSEKGVHEIILVKDLKYKITLNGGEVWLSDAHLMY